MGGQTSIAMRMKMNRDALMGVQGVPTPKVIEFNSS
jgi:hypothetical protein